MAELVSDATARLDETREIVREFRSADEGSLDEQRTAWSEALEALRGETADRLRDDVQAPVTEAIQAVGEALGTLADDMNAARETSAGLREEVSTLLDGLTQAMEPMPGAIDAVKAAAEIVGLTWS